MNIIKVSASRWNFKDEILRFRCCNVLDWGNKNYIDHFGPSFNILKNFNNRMDSHKFVFFIFFSKFINLLVLNLIFYFSIIAIRRKIWFTRLTGTQTSHRFESRCPPMIFFIIYFFKKNLISRIEDTFE